MSVDDLLSRAVRLFVTREPLGFPHLDPERLEQEFGDVVAELRPKLEALLTEMLALPFQGEDLVAATRAAEATMSARHPELGPDAVAALGFYYGYCWR
ncbi:hypothetical protein [Streptomyces sp. NPDC047028]|uniref:hypothetical protein n=1 Tax=Streptomyces sp. NPDC047028 TaxID=3155793 RepID=UPI0033C8448E